MCHRVSRIRVITLQYKHRVCGIGKASCTSSTGVLMGTSVAVGETLAASLLVIDARIRTMELQLRSRIKIARITVNTDLQSCENEISHQYRLRGAHYRLLISL